MLQDCAFIFVQDATQLIKAKNLLCQIIAAINKTDQTISCKTKICQTGNSSSEDPAEDTSVVEHALLRYGCIISIFSCPCLFCVLQYTSTLCIIFDYDPLASCVGDANVISMLYHDKQLPCKP